MLIDTHAHISFPDFASEIEEVLKRAQDADIRAIIDVGTNLEGSQKSIGLANAHKMVFAAVGMHPQDATKENIARFDELKELIKSSEKVLAIGETGLDYFHMHAPKENQVQLFKKHIILAQEANLPLIIHARDKEPGRAGEDALLILDEFKSSSLKGVFHCFAGDQDFLKKVLDRGFHVSFTGIITFPKAEGTRQVLKQVPLDRLMLETDCPFLAPSPLRGKRNEPSYMCFIADKAAEVLGVSVRAIEEASTNNAKALFKIPI